MKNIKKYFENYVTVTKATLLGVMVALLFIGGISAMGISDNQNYSKIVVEAAEPDYEKYIAELEAQVKDLQETVEILEAKNASINADRERCLNFLESAYDQNNDLQKIIEEKNYLIQVAYCALWRAPEITINHVDAWFGYMSEEIDSHYIETIECVDGTMTHIKNVFEYNDVCNQLDSYRNELVTIIAEEGQLSELTFVNMMRIPERISEDMSEEIDGFAHSGYYFWNYIEPYLGR